MPSVFASSTIVELLRSELSMSAGWALGVAAFIHAFLLINFFAVVPLFFIWLERKVAGRIQDRLGPTRVGGRFGWLQTLADGIKLIQKEDLAPTVADHFLFRMSPYLAVVAAFSAFLVLPFAQGWVAVDLDIAVFLIFALMSLEVLGIILAGYSSGSKWSLFGGMREAAQMVSYEIPLAICALVPLVAAGSLNFGELSLMQKGWIWEWFIFLNPFTFLAFFVYFTVATASVKRAPFDLAEAESELVGGFHTEYSGLRWSFFFMAEYAAMFAVSGIAALLFLGGWHTGIAPIEASLLDPLRTWKPNFIIEGFTLGNFLVNCFGAVVFISKAFLLVFVQIWVRWTFPRLRIDQVMTTCLKYLVPISCFLFLGTIVWPLALLQAAGRTTVLEQSQPLGERVRDAAEANRTLPASSAEPPGVSTREELPSRLAAAGHEEARAMTAGELMFWIFAAAACGGALAVVVTQNVVRMAFWLVVSLGSTSGLFFLLHSDFVGATQLLIYVGGTVVLLIFGVMLTATGPYLQINTSSAEGFLGAGVGALFLLLILSTVVSVKWDQLDDTASGTDGVLANVEAGFSVPERGNTARPLGMGLLGLRPDKDLGAADDAELSTGYLLPFEIVSIHLLVVLIGAGYLARAKRRVRPVGSEQ